MTNIARQDTSNNAQNSPNEADGDERPAKKGRGLAKKTPQWGKNKLNILVNDNWQPCGGDYKELGTQIGFFMKDGHLFPLTETWKDMDLIAIERVWAEIQVTNIYIYLNFLFLLISFHLCYRKVLLCIIPLFT